MLERVAALIEGRAEEIARADSLTSGVPIGVTREGVKRVDVDELYDADEYKPKVRHVAGKPMFLY